MIVISPVVLFAGAGNPPCQARRTSQRAAGRRTAAWIATAYGPPWDAIERRRRHRHRHRTSGPASRAYEIAVDPTVIALQSFEHVSPNPFGTRHAFYAGDTGGAIIGHHVDIYDWRGRAAQDAWGVRHVTRHPGAEPRHRQPARRDHADRTEPARPRRTVAGGCASRGGRAAAAHPRAAGEDPPERARRRAERRADRR